MLTRSTFPRQKDVMIINDVPVKVELENEEKFSASSNLGLLTAFRTGRVNIYNHKPVQGYKGIFATNIFTTYLDYTYYGEPELENNFDFHTEFRKRKDLKEMLLEGSEEIYLIDKETERLTVQNLEKVCFEKLETQKDVYVSRRLYKTFLELLEEIKKVEPKMIIVTGKWGLFFLTACTSLAQTQGTVKDKKPLGGISKFRSSVMQPHELFSLPETILIPIYHTVHAMGMPDKVPIMELDVQKVAWMYHVIKDKGVGYYIKPDKQFIIGTDKEIIISYLDRLLHRLYTEEEVYLSIDVETMYHSFIDCIGITDSTESGLCIPFASKDNPNLWTIEDEEDIMVMLREVMLHPNGKHVGQNYSYDMQYFHKLWLIDVVAEDDTMVLHHVLYNYMPKDLAMLASLYAETYTYWKDDVTALAESPETRWIYNVKDVCYTLEIQQVLKEILEGEKPELQEFYRFQQIELSPALVEIMNRGVKVDLEKKQQLLNDLSTLLIHIETMINDILGEEINLKSSQQVKRLFIDLLNVTPIVDRKRKTPSFGSEAMLVYLDQYILYRPLITLILEYRSVGIFVRTFLSAQVDDDNRMRTSYNVAGTRTYRLASRKNAFGNGMNLQNVPSKGKIDLKYSLLDMDRESEVELEDGFDTEAPIYGSNKLPNCKELFICEEDEMFFDIDLAAADARIMAWTSGCKFLTELFEEEDGDPYLLLATEYYRDKTITKKDYRRQIFKAIVHGINYLGRANTLSAKAGLLVHEIEKIQRFYFSLCPEIPQLHKDVEGQVRSRGYLENCWGARGWFLDKNDPMLMNKAVAWVGSSPVGILINKGLVSIRENDKDIKVLLQVHDSVAGVFKKTDITAPERIKQHCSIALPFEVPRIIPVNIRTSELSYGNC